MDGNITAALRADFLTVDQEHFSIRRPFLGKVVDVLTVSATKRFVVRDEFLKLDISSYDRMFIELFWDEIWVDFKCSEIYGRRILRRVSLAEYSLIKEEQTSIVEVHAFIKKMIWPVFRPINFFLRGSDAKIHNLRLTRKIFRGWKIEINNFDSIRRGCLVFSHKP